MLDCGLLAPSPQPLAPSPASPTARRLEILDALPERALDGVVPVAAGVDLLDQVTGGVGEMGVEGFFERSDLGHRDRQSVVQGQSVSVRVDLVGRRFLKKKIK